MTIEELKKEAEEALKRGGYVILRIPKGKYPRKFIRGTLLAEELKEGVIFRVYCFDPQKILEFINRAKEVSN